MLPNAPPQGKMLLTRTLLIKLYLYVLIFHHSDPPGASPVVQRGSFLRPRRRQGLRAARWGSEYTCCTTMAEKEGPDFGKLAVALGFIAQEDLDKILRIQGDLHKIG